MVDCLSFPISISNRLLQDVTSAGQMDALVASWNDYDVDRSGDPNCQAERDGSVVFFGRDHRKSRRSKFE